MSEYMACFAIQDTSVQSSLLNFLHIKELHAATTPKM